MGRYPNYGITEGWLRQQVAARDDLIRLLVRAGVSLSGTGLIYTGDGGVATELTGDQHALLLEVLGGGPG